MSSEIIKKIKFLATKRGDLITEEFLIAFVEKYSDLIQSRNAEGLIEIIELEDPVFKELVFSGKNIAGKEFDQFWLEKLRNFKL